MKKSLSVLSILLIAVLICCGCGSEGAQEAPELTGQMDAAETEKLLEESLEAVEVLESLVNEYGELVSYDHMEGKLLAHILYPKGEITALNEAIEEWITEEAAYYLTYAEEFVQEDGAAELTVEAQSRITDENLVSVQLKGIYEAPFMAHPIDIVKTFNGSLSAGKLVMLEDITADGGLDILKNMVVEDAGVEEEWVDENLLNHWFLTPDGLEITLARGDYLPMSDGTKIFTYTYEELDGILDLTKTSADSSADLTEDSDQPQSEDESESVPEGILPGEEDDGEKPDPDKPMLALTFDDGPSAHTDRLLNAFAEHGGKGTFFVVGNLIDNRPETLVRMAENGHEIAGHSWNHRQLTTLTEEDLKDQIMNTRAKIYDTAGVDALLIRPPYGSFNDDVQAQCREYGIALVNWSVDTLDWKYRDADTVYKSVMDQAKDGAIILCHDLHGTTVDAMERAIPDLIAEGYQLVTVTELLTSQGAEIEAGKMYYKR